jgi:hypothetical protein
MTHELKEAMTRLAALDGREQEEAAHFLRLLFQVIERRRSQATQPSS